jgi:stage V sporulation protein R
MNGCYLQENDTKLVLQHLADLWGYDVLLQEIDSSSTVAREHAASPRKIVQ